VAGSTVQWNGGRAHDDLRERHQADGSDSGRGRRGHGTASVTVVTPRRAAAPRPRRPSGSNTHRPDAHDAVAVERRSVGGAGFTLTLTGRNGFVNGATVQWNGARHDHLRERDASSPRRFRAADLAATGTASGHRG